LAASLFVSAAAVAPSVGRAATTCDRDWPTFQHDISRTGSATCGGVAAATVSSLIPGWFFSTSGAVTAEPAVAAGSVYAGDSNGVMHAVDAATGAQRWSFDITSNAMHVDQHKGSFAGIVSSASVASVPSLGRTVFFGGGGTVYAVDATTGAPRWAVDVDPANPTSPAEVESSPLVWTRGDGTDVVFVGMDTNEAKGTIDGGVLALNARTGALLWKYDADSNTVVHDLTTGDHSGTACGDIWSSPALDPQRGLLYFGGGNCNLPGGGDTQRLIAVHADGGAKAWEFFEPAANHGRDQDFGASPVLTDIRGTDVVVQAGKSGWVYVLDRDTGAVVRSVRAAQGADYGGFIGSVTVAPGPNGDPVLFGNTAVPVPTSGTVDPTLSQDPERATSLHAVDLATGAVVWHTPAQSVSFAPTTSTGGVVFAPDTTELSINAYAAADGTPLWHLPVAAATAGGVAVVGDTIVFGTGTYFGPPVPPQLTGIWSFRLAAAAG
jgi:polyvinyl alcohol dehydrogenase (cytochrome)